MRAPTTFLLVRHGQSTGNLFGGTVMAGWVDLPLTERGFREAHELAERLASEPSPSAIYSSPLQRAARTAAVIAERLSAEPPRLDPALREIDCGEVDGWPSQLVQERHPQAWATNRAQADPDFRWPGGESYRELRERALRALEGIARAHPAQRVLVVTHAGIISQLLGSLEGESPARWERFRPHNASVTELRWGSALRELVRFDDCAHLTLPARAR